jgi:hypothetical protein
VIQPHGEREVVGTATNKTSFKISESDTAHIMIVLRDAIYSDKVLAVMREYGANAQDSHRDPAAAPGARERPIVVRLPTLSDPTLQISDHGPGLSHGAVMRLFTQYGASTKRDQADATGYIGIGCKAGFAYSDSFTVTSRHGGASPVYSAVLDESDRGEMRLLDESPCEPGDTGLTIWLPVRPGDVEEFRSKAPQVFRYYDPQPIVLLGDERLPLGDGACDVVRGCAWTAVMGCVSYPIEVGQLKVPEYVRQSGGVARFPLGQLSVSASREALRYDERTRTALARGLCALVDAHAARLVQGAEGLNDWEKRLRFAGMGLFAPLLQAASFDGVFHEVVLFPRRSRGEEKMKVRFSSEKMVVSTSARIVFHDDARAIAGYNLDSHAVVARKTPGSTHEEAWEELQAVLAQQRLCGLPVVRASSLPWGSPGTAGSRGPQTRHRGRVFRLLPGEPAPGAPPSARWERLDRDPQPGDLFVPIMGFRPHPWFWGRYASACRAFAAFGLQHPPVYGYRVLGEDSKVPGTDYADWLKTAYSVVRASRPDLDDLYHISRYSNVQCDSSSPRLVGEMLGDDHPIAALARTALQARRSRIGMHGAQENLIVYAGTLARLAGKDGDPDYSCLDRYPLLRQRANEFLSSANLGEWMEYVLAVDAAIGAGYRHGAWRERAKAAEAAKMAEAAKQAQAKQAQATKRPARASKTSKTNGRKAEETP